MTVYERPEHPDQTPKIHLAPAAAAKLGTGRHHLAAAGTAAGAVRAGDLAGWRSLGHDHRPTHASARQGRGEKTVRWYG
ncbi:hypothetical protein [Arthrobacter mobilis]|uniref:Uncharacterized protein n=1 Tax=Arthrobacter mobilis TaxID=2724944 RepID=A0A7X6HDC4_9MICC|nr:hypothetical protein [Arthrobacter mobilis]NKX55062.1 hypothetical protein [Arthrobacter mobilis]